MTALADRGLPLAKCCACGKAGDVDDLASLRLTGQCPDCLPTRTLRIKGAPGVELSFPPERSDRAACSIPTGFTVGQIFGGVE